MRHDVIVRSERGIALVVAILVIAVLSALGLSLLVTLAIEPRAGANHRAATAALYAAEAALELAVLEVDSTADWDGILSGSVRSALVDGLPSGIRTLPDGQTVNLTLLTNRLVCGRLAGCTDAFRTMSTSDRPWGANNPDWRPFLYGTPTDVALPELDAQYLAVWVGDDAMEQDGDPRSDDRVGEGRMAVRVRATAWGTGGARRTVEAVFVRRCALESGEERCDPGSRVQSWRDLHGAVP